MATFSDLPVELWQMVSDYLMSRDLAQFRCTCTRAANLRVLPHYDILRSYPAVRCVFYIAHGLAQIKHVTSAFDANEKICVYDGYPIGGDASRLHFYATEWLFALLLCGLRDVVRKYKKPELGRKSYVKVYVVTDGYLEGNSTYTREYLNEQRDVVHQNMGRLFRILPPARQTSEFIRDLVAYVGNHNSGDIFATMPLSKFITECPTDRICERTKALGLALVSRANLRDKNAFVTIWWLLSHRCADGHSSSLLNIRDIIAHGQLKRNRVYIRWLKKLFKLQEYAKKIMRDLPHDPRFIYEALP